MTKYLQTEMINLWLSKLLNLNILLNMKFYYDVNCCSVNIWLRVLKFQMSEINSTIWKWWFLAPRTFEYLVSVCYTLNQIKLILLRLYLLYYLMILYIFKVFVCIWFLMKWNLIGKLKRDEWDKHCKCMMSESKKNLF